MLIRNRGAKRHSRAGLTASNNLNRSHYSKPTNEVAAHLGRFCSSLETRRVTGSAGTRRLWRSPSAGTSSGSRRWDRDRMAGDWHYGRLVEQRKRAGLRQIDVAERMGVSKARVSHIENGRSRQSNCSLDTLRPSVAAWRSPSPSTAALNALCWTGQPRSTCCVRVEPTSLRR